MLNQQILIGHNEHGYYTSTGNVNCVLLATLNLLQEAYGLDSNSSVRIIKNWNQLWDQDREANFLAPLRVPLTIEHITDGAFFGRVIVPNAAKNLRDSGIPEKYGLDRPYIDGSMVPFIWAEDFTQNDLCHAVAALRFDPHRGYHVIDNGDPVDLVTLPTPGIAYKVEKSR